MVSSRDCLGGFQSATADTLTHMFCAAMQPWAHGAWRMICLHLDRSTRIGHAFCATTSRLPGALTGILHERIGQRASTGGLTCCSGMRKLVQGSAAAVKVCAWLVDSSSAWTSCRGWHVTHVVLYATQLAAPAEIQTPIDDFYGPGMSISTSSNKLQV